ncbi:MAG TPA: hypothetical protein DDY52_00085 [Candidatus Moranbacteria bacterium]|nr:MAG: hypothetical protein UR51_C0011G0050 [Candidatus Moranbacteria bacterium GW2011_GWF1_34_10]HBI16546.1 hypothetical protein [Candidatus Moranbacteria bacterium]
MKCDCKKCDKGPGHLLMMLSVITLVLSAVVSLFKVELYLAGTQWMLVSILLAIYASIFFLTNKECENVGK